MNTAKHPSQEPRTNKSKEHYSLLHSRTVRDYCFLLPLLALGAAGVLSVFSGSATDEKRISVYSTVANYSLPVTERSGRDYVGLLEILEPLGPATAKNQGRRWKLRYKHVEAEFTSGHSRSRIHGKDVELGSAFLLENGRGLVSLTSLPAILPRFLGAPVVLHENARRLFLGNVATQFTATFSKTIPPRLVLNFSSPVNPTISTEPGRLRMMFTREPLVQSGGETLTFGDSTIPSASYRESNGAAEIAVAGNQPLMAMFSNDGRSITIAPAPQASMAAPAASATPPPQMASPAPPTANVPPPVASLPPPSMASSTAPNLPHFLAVVDASHGGDERGAALTPDLPEKDVTLSVARRVRQELQNRGISVLMLRDSDTNLGLDQRAALANMAQASVYICIHASSQGNGVRLYTATIPSGGGNRGPFVAWDAGQAAFLPLSQAVMGNVAAELQKRTAVRTLSAPMRPLNNVTAAVFALELAPPGNDVLDLASPVYQQLVATAIGTGVAGYRDRSGVHP